MLSIFTSENFSATDNKLKPHSHTRHTKPVTATKIDQKPENVKHLKKISQKYNERLEKKKQSLQHDHSYIFKHHMFQKID